MSFRSLSRTSLVAFAAVSTCAAFSSPTTFGVRPALTLYSSIGGGLGGGKRPPGDGGRRRRRRGGGDDWDDFLDPNQDENENIRRANELRSEQNLPISFDPNKIDNEDGEDEAEQPKSNSKEKATASSSPNGSALVFATSGSGDVPEELTEEMLNNNPYMQVVSSLSPSDLISKFTTTAHPRVQDAVRRTILGLIGGLPKMAFETNTITTGQRLASLMFQLQMTGYMFKNAEWQLSLAQSLGMAPGSDEMPNRYLSLPTNNSEKSKKKKRIDPLKGKVKGKLKVRYGPKTAKEAADEADSKKGMEVEVDAAAYLSELRTEVSKLRNELSSKKKEKEEALRKDLLMYIRTLPEQNLRSLTNTISQDVLVAMKGLVNVVLAGIGDGEIGPETVTEQSGEAMAQLCMWQLVVGYNLRELEYREEMKNSLMAQFGAGSVDAKADGGGPSNEGGVDLSEPGVME